MGNEKVTREVTKKMVDLYTGNGKERFARVRFDGWHYEAPVVMDILAEEGYSFKVDCATYRHHAVIAATKTA